MSHPKHATLPPTRPPCAAQRPYEVRSACGTRIDEYYWMRDDERSSPEVLDHLRAENAWSRAVLAPHEQAERSLLHELEERIPPQESTAPVWRSGAWYSYRYEAGAEHPRLVRRVGSLDAPEQVLLDIEALAKGHDYFDVEGIELSPDGRLLAYAQDTTGRRQHTLRVRDLDHSMDLPVSIANVEADFAWSADGGTVLYIEKDPVTLLSVRVRSHVLGAPADGSADRLVYEEADDSYYLGVRMSRSREYLFVDCASTEQTEVLACRADDPGLRFTPVVPRRDGHEYEAEHLGDEFLLRTNLDARNFRLVRAPVGASADPSRWTEVLAHREHVLLEDFEAGTHGICVNERERAVLGIRVLDLEGRELRRVEPPLAHCVMELDATPGIDSPWMRFRASSLVEPERTIDVDLRSGEQVVRKIESVPGYQSARYRTRLDFIPARDGASIPVSLAWREDTPLDGSAPLYQYGYGAYGLSMDASFDSSWVSLLDRGFVVAIAHVRGGQELGRDWFDDGRLLRKHNTFQDFVDVTTELVRLGVAAPDGVVASGGSAGGLLMGVLANIAPERYRAIVAHVPFVDIVTTMLDESIPLTTNEYDQWGDPREPVHYANMLSYSPYDNVGPGPHPAMMVFTGLWDSQVQYWEPAKWVARLRARGTGSQPLLLLTDLAAGHGGKAGRYEQLRETATEYAFLTGVVGLGHPPSDPS